MLSCWPLCQIKIAVASQWNIVLLCSIKIAVIETYGNYTRLYSCSPGRVSRKTVDCVWDGVLHEEVTQTLCTAHLLLRVRFVMTPCSAKDWVIRNCELLSLSLSCTNYKMYWLKEVDGKMSFIEISRQNVVDNPMDVMILDIWWTKQVTIPIQLFYIVIVIITYQW